MRPALRSGSRGKKGRGNAGNSDDTLGTLFVRLVTVVFYGAPAYGIYRLAVHYDVLGLLIGFSLGILGLLLVGYINDDIRNKYFK